VSKYDETIKSLEHELEELEADASKLESELSSKQTRMAQVKESIISLSRLSTAQSSGWSPNPMLTRLMEESAEGGLTDAVCRVLQASYSGLTPTAVRNGLVKIGYDITLHSNIMATVHTCLKRLERSDKVRLVDLDGKAGYIWVRPEGVMP
jgi:hypothetical protein